MTRPLAITLGTVGRFHAFDLAAQLDRRGHLVAIYTGYPRRNFRDMAVNPKRIRPFPWLQTPVALAQRAGLVPPSLLQPLGWWSHQLIDRHIAHTLPDCHVLWVMSSGGLAAGREAHRRNIAYVCDRGSTHIVMQDRLLREEHERHGFHFPGIDPRTLAKEQAEYAEADAVTVPSGFARDSFLRMGVPAAKLHRIPYGVDLGAFRPIVPHDGLPRAGPPRGGEFRVLFVGALSLRKGLPYLLQAFGRAALGNARLVLVGAPVAETEVLLARHPVANLERLGALPRARVVEEMSRAGVLVLPSIEDGFGLVMAQAMACSCPIIASGHTGAADLFEDGREGFIVPVRDPEAIADRLARLHGDPELRAAMGEAALARVRTIGGWDVYGRAALALFLRLARARGYEVEADIG